MYEVYLELARLGTALDDIVSSFKDEGVSVSILVEKEHYKSGRDTSYYCEQ